MTRFSLGELALLWSFISVWCRPQKSLRSAPLSTKAIMLWAAHRGHRCGLPPDRHPRGRKTMEDSESCSRIIDLSFAGILQFWAGDVVLCCIIAFYELSVLQAGLAQERALSLLLCLVQLVLLAILRRRDTTLQSAGTRPSTSV